MSLFSRIGQALNGAETRTAVAPDYTGPLPGVIPPSRAGDTGTGFVSVREAMSISSVSASVRLIGTAVSQLDMTVTRGGVEVVSGLVAQPDRYRSASSFFKRTVNNLSQYGNAYWRLYRNIDGAVVNLESLDPNRVRVYYDDNGTKLYDYTDGQGKSFTFKNNVPGDNSGQVEHIRLGEFAGEILGLGPIQVNNAALYSILEQRWYYERFLRESKRPSGIYAVKSADDVATLKAIKQQIQENRTTGEPDVLPGDITYSTVMFTAEEAALIEMNKAGVLEVARMFGVPPYKLASGVEGNSMTYQNIGQADRAWVRESLEEYLTAIEDAMTSVLPRGQVAQFNTENWLRAAESISTTTTEKETATDTAA